MKRLTIITTAYRSAKYLRSYFEGVLELDHLDQLQVILVMNVPDRIERQIAQEYQERYPSLFKIIEAGHRETIGASLNRGLALADTPYVGLLDVDDIRVSDSYDRQMITLDENPDVDYTYGGFVVVRKQGENEGRYVSTLEFDPIEFTRGCYTSPTQLFRTNLLEKVGGFDEQLKSGADFDFQVRATFNCKLKKTPGILCYYTKYANSNSTSSSILQPIERTVIELRYGQYDKTVLLNGYPYVRRATKYRLDKLLINGQWQPIERYVPHYRQMMAQREPARLAFEKNYRRGLIRDYATRPFRFARCAAKGAARGMLARLGLLDKVRTIRNGSYRSTRNQQ